MTNEEAVRWLSVIRADLTGLKRCSPKELQALDHAIAVLERDAATGKAIDHSEQALDMADILRELVELRHIKTTQGKTPEYLERQPKAWARAEQAVK